MVCGSAALPGVVYQRLKHLLGRTGLRSVALLSLRLILSNKHRDHAVEVPDDEARGAAVLIISWHLLERYNIVSLENVLDAEAKIKA